MKFLGTLVFCLLLVGCSINKQEEENGYKYLYENLPFEMQEVKKPQIPEREFNLSDYGAKGDGEFKNTVAFKKAIEALNENGGGTLVVPQGIWLTGPIEMVSNMNLHLQKGALIVFSRDFDDYPIVETSFEGLDTRRCQSPLSGRNLKNIAITGPGSIDGSGDAWRPVKKQKVTAKHWKQITSKGGAFKRDDYWFPSVGALKGDALSNMNVPQNLHTEAEWMEIRDFLRPVMVSLIECENVLLQDACFSNSPSWNIHPLMCTNVIIDNITVRNPSYAQNGDGLDLESCKNVIIVNSQFDVGDDGICIKSGKDEDGRRRGRPTENVIVENCVVYKGHGGFVVGSEMSGGVKNIKVSNCSFLGTDVGLRFKSRRGRGGVVENIYVSDITMQDIVTDALSFNLYYGGRSASEELSKGGKMIAKTNIPKVTEETPCFRNLYFNNIVSKDSRRAMYFNGLPELKISGIHIENAVMSAKIGAQFCEAENITLNNVAIYPQSGAAVQIENVSDIEFTDVRFANYLEYGLEVLGAFNNYKDLTNSFKDKVLISE
ncbi:glycoside hydrolase family 28 protein [Carboxylicivirga linearis]|uniref:Glycoside hydrolase family 28 protein n=1 Tax=Carboxylicivirga linearis TaxID=1628157 RepID=A0ABS5JSH2_9BACT|nr:glycoside hydrolase family 28 protein [Carboxylicivirga linearis]MBS2097411.1 glycoside hydrolase family 28 protein [Carboxylicivirga linearis]